MDPTGTEAGLPAEGVGRLPEFHEHDLVERRQLALRPESVICRATLYEEQPPSHQNELHDKGVAQRDVTFVCPKALYKLCNLCQHGGLETLSADEFNTLQIEVSEETARLQREYEMLETCNGPPQVIRLLGGTFNHRGDTKSIVKIVQEDVTSSLESMVGRGEGPHKLVQKVLVLLDIAEGLKALWDRGVIHTQLCPANVYHCDRTGFCVANFSKAVTTEEADFFNDRDLVDEPGSDDQPDPHDGHGPDLEPDPADELDMDEELDSDEEPDFEIDSSWGQKGYVPPEGYRGKIHEKRDVFAFGSTAYFVMTGRNRLQDVPDSVVAASFRADDLLLESKPLPEYWPEELLAFVHRCFSINPEDRPEPAEIVSLLEGMLARARASANLARDLHDQVLRHQPKAEFSPEVRSLLLGYQVDEINCRKDAKLPGLPPLCPSSTKSDTRVERSKNTDRHKPGSEDRFVQMSPADRGDGDCCSSSNPDAPPNAGADDDSANDVLDSVVAPTGKESEQSADTSCSSADDVEPTSSSVGPVRPASHTEVSTREEIVAGSIPDSAGPCPPVSLLSAEPLQSIVTGTAAYGAPTSSPTSLPTVPCAIRAISAALPNAGDFQTCTGGSTRADDEITDVFGSPMQFTESDWLSVTVWHGMFGEDHLTSDDDDDSTVSASADNSDGSTEGSNNNDCGAQVSAERTLSHTDDKSVCQGTTDGRMREGGFTTPQGVVATNDSPDAPACQLTPTGAIPDLPSSADMDDRDPGQTTKPSPKEVMDFMDSHWFGASKPHATQCASGASACVGFCSECQQAQRAAAGCLPACRQLCRLVSHLFMR